jgi:hypothetical protein
MQGFGQDNHRIDFAGILALSSRQRARKSVQREFTVCREGWGTLNSRETSRDE